MLSWGSCSLADGHCKEKFIKADLSMGAIDIFGTTQFGA
jgi:hypothetical protein